MLQFTSPLASAPSWDAEPRDTPHTDPARQPLPGLSAIAGPTLVETQDGSRRADTLSPGDLLETRDNGPVAVEIVEFRIITAEMLRIYHDAAPIRVEEGAPLFHRLSGTRLVSPDQHILVEAPDADGADGGTLVPARALCDGGHIRRVIPEERVIYVALRCARAQLINAGGLWVEIGRLAGHARHASGPIVFERQTRPVFTPL
ncbi:Hint domain-containing protein [Hasllibacter sp. MH4015]|uniref:Hint domain-containing protein n=1 Tax=Hasllibacter sp. MH4015 TaxID=2854029 RepID=UPI001CD5893A|nr:Hint domain-containing protein [Hasllibacter sp. MH4015]